MWKGQPKAIWGTACARQCEKVNQKPSGTQHVLDNVGSSVRHLLVGVTKTQGTFYYYREFFNWLLAVGHGTVMKLLLKHSTTNLGAALRHLLHALVDQVLQVRPGGRASLSDRWNWGVLQDKKTFTGWCQARRWSLTEWQVELGSSVTKTLIGWCQARRWSLAEWQVKMGSSVTKTLIGWCQARRWSLAKWQVELGSSVTKTLIEWCQARRWSLAEWQVELGSSARQKGIHWMMSGQEVEPHWVTGGNGEFCNKDIYWMVSGQEVEPHWVTGGNGEFCQTQKHSLANRWRGWGDLTVWFVELWKSVTYKEDTNTLLVDVIAFSLCCCVKILVNCLFNLYCAL